MFPLAGAGAAGRAHDTYPIWGTCHTVTLQPSTSPLLPFDRLVATNQVRWVEGGATLATQMTAGFIAQRTAVLDLAAGPAARTSST